MFTAVLSQPDFKMGGQRKIFCVFYPEVLEPEDPRFKYRNR